MMYKFFIWVSSSAPRLTLKNQSYYLPMDGPAKRGQKLCMSWLTKTDRTSIELREQTSKSQTLTA